MVLGLSKTRILEIWLLLWALLLICSVNLAVSSTLPPHPAASVSHSYKEGSLPSLVGMVGASVAASEV